jgi:hypothetical protein
VLTPKERREAWRAYWAAKRAKRTGLTEIPYIGDELREFWE